VPTRAKVIVAAPVDPVDLCDLARDFDDSSFLFCR
jgi:hypothetical protein